jgi:hypothetical protein
VECCWREEEFSLTDVPGSDTDQFRRYGCAVLDTTLGGTLTALRERFIAVFSAAATHQGFDPVSNDADLASLYNGLHKPIWNSAYHQLKYLPEALQLATSEELLEAAHSLGIEFPSLCGFPVTRVDMPSDRDNILGAHQDYPYHKGSSESLTFWIALQDTDVALGPVAVARGSHLNGEIATSEGIITDLRTLSEYEFESPPVHVGQVLAMSQMLVHRSGLNSSDRVRFSIQIRFNDLGDADYGRRYFFVNEGSTQVFVSAGDEVETAVSSELL